jgi:hypothetical protein
LYADETTILEAVDKWARKKIAANGKEVNGKNVRKYLGECFYQVRVPTLTSELLLRSVSRKGYFSVEEYADISGYINRIPDVSVSTNSSVRRIRETETVRIVRAAKEKDKYIHDGIYSTVLIDVERDVCLSNVVLGKLCPYERLKNPVYSPLEDLFHEKVLSISQNNINVFWNKIVQVKSVLGQEIKGYVLEPIKELELPEYLSLDISGSVAIESLSFKQDFQIRQFHEDDNVINVIPELILKKESSPYNLKVILRYSCGRAIKIGEKVAKKPNYGFSQPSNHLPAAKTQSCHIRTSYVAGFPGAIKSMGFKNFSNRDIEPVLGLTIKESNEQKNEQENSGTVE